MMSFSVENDAARFIDMPSGSISQKRDVQREMEMDAAVSAFSRNMMAKANAGVLREDVDAIYEFLQSGIHALEELGEVYISEKMKRCRF